MLSVLLVEDDFAIREMLQHFLVSKKFNVLEAEDAAQAFQCLEQSNPDLILLDWMLPDSSGPEIIKKIRNNPIQKDIPIIMLTAKAEESDKIKGLDSGADDYMTKPVSLHELSARINALIRRSQGLTEEKIIKIGHLSLNIENYQVKAGDEPIKMAKTELNLLHYLMKRPDCLHSRSHLLDQVWGQGTFIEERTVDVHILRLRKLLKPYGLANHIETVRGLGYRFVTTLTAIKNE